MSIATEGLPYYGGFFLISLVMFVVDFPVVAILFLLLSLFSLYFFRDPVRQTAGGERAFISPADGKVIAIKTVHHDFFKSDCLMISIFMTVFDVHINRCCYSGKVIARHYRPGKFLAAYKDAAVEFNEQNEIWIEADHFRFVINQIAGVIARRIRCWIEVGEIVSRGQKIGLIQFGSRLDVYVPQDFVLEIERGDQVYAGKTVLGIPPIGKE